MSRSIIVSNSPKFACGLLAGMSLCAACAVPESFHPQPTTGLKPISCQISRQECTTPPSADGGNVVCGAIPVTFQATACTEFRDLHDSRGAELPVNACKREFCTATPGDPYVFSSCNVDFGVEATFPSAAGICSNDPAAASNASVTYTTRSRRCAAGACNVVTASHDDCIRVDETPAKQQLLPPSDEFMRSVQIVAYVANSSCTPAPDRLTFALSAGKFASASSGSTHADLSLVDGFISVGQGCYGESCFATSIESLRANVTGMTVAGVALTNAGFEAPYAVPISTIPDESGGHPGILPRDLKLIVKGKMAGLPVLLRAANSDALALNFDAGGLGLVGDFDFVGLDLAGRPVPVTISVDVHATPATPAQEACANASTLEQLFGFESGDGWFSSQASLAEVASPVTQGCAALSVSGQGYMTMVGAPFSTRRITPKASLSVDLFVPDHQPNPYWIGAAQMFLSCPSGNVNNQYIGQVDLTGKPQNRYSTLRFPLPSAISSALRRPLDDCSLSLALNVNATGRPWLFDNLRFTP